MLSVTLLGTTVQEWQFGGCEGALTLSNGKSQVPLALQLLLEPGGPEKEVKQSSQALPVHCCLDLLLRREGKEMRAHLSPERKASG